MKRQTNRHRRVGNAGEREARKPVTTLASLQARILELEEALETATEFNDQIMSAVVDEDGDPLTVNSLVIAQKFLLTAALPLNPLPEKEET